jgi:hypothetical protein
MTHEEIQQISIQYTRRGDVVNLPGGKIGLTESFEVHGNENEFIFDGVNVRHIDDEGRLTYKTQVDPNLQVNEPAANFEELL